MSDEPEDGAPIRTGLRWQAVDTAIDAARDALAAPAELDWPDGAPTEPDKDDRDEDDRDEDGSDEDDDDEDDDDEEDEDADDAGWTEDTRAEVLEAVRRVRDELADGVETAEVLDRWRAVDVDDLDLEEPTPESDAVLDLDLALSDLERAESALGEAVRLQMNLDEPITPSDRDDGFDEAVRDELTGLLREIRAVLASGGMLPVDLMDRWADALRALGYLRAVERPGVDDDGRAVGFTRQRIEQFPPGRRFEPVAIFDGWLYNIGFTDTMEELELEVSPELDDEVLAED